MAKMATDKVLADVFNNHLRPDQRCTKCGWKRDEPEFDLCWECAMEELMRHPMPSNRSIPTEVDRG